MKKCLVFLFIFGCLFVQAVFSLGSSANKPAQPSAAERLDSAQTRTNEAEAVMERAFAQNDLQSTLEDQYYLGRAVAANILSIYRLYTGNPALVRYLNLICQAILINSTEIALYDGCHVAVLDSTELNAFASPGGHIFITKGLVEAAVSEDMLAAVIAHELAHIKLKHGIKMIEEMRFFADMNAVADRGFEFSGNSAGAQRLAQFRSSVSAMTNTMLRNGYSQDQEFEADREAVSLMSAAGYDPDALVAVLKVLYDNRDIGGMNLNATHPSALERVVQLDRWIGAYNVPDTRRYRSPRFRTN